LALLTLLTVLTHDVMKLAIMTRTEVLAPESAELVADRIRELAEEARSEKRPVRVSKVLEAVREGQGPVVHWLTSTEAAERLGVSRNTVKKWARTGYLRGSRRDPEGWWRIPEPSVERVARIESDLAAVPVTEDLSWRP